MGLLPIRNSLRNAFNVLSFMPEHIVFYPEKGANKKTHKVMNHFINAHNKNARKSNKTEMTMLNSTAASIMRDSSLRKTIDAFKLSAQIATDPVNYIKGKYGHSKAQRAIDLVIVGPAAAIADTIVNLVLVLVTAVAFLTWSAIFAYNKICKQSTSISKDRILDSICDSAAYFGKAVHSAMRIFPIVGPLIAYSVSILCSVDYTDIIRSKTIEKIARWNEF